MIAAFLSLITSKLAGPIALVAALALLGWATVERIQLAGARHTVATLTDRIENKTTGYIAELATCTGNTARLNAAIGDQNTAIAAAGAAAAKTAAALDQAAKVSADARAVAASRAAAVAALKPGADRCASAEALLRSPS